MLRIYLLLGAALLSGCATDVANRYYGSVVYSEKPVEQVEVLRQKPARSFAVIADFQSKGETVQDLRAKAAKIGADAVIVAVIGGLYRRDEQWAGKDSMASLDHAGAGRIVGTAIVYK